MQDDTGIDFVVESVVLLGSLARGRATNNFHSKIDIYIPYTIRALGVWGYNLESVFIVF